MINPNSGVINDGWTRPTDESMDDLKQQGIRMVDADCGHRVPASQVRSGFVGVTFPMEYSACHICRHGEGCDCGEGEDQ
jgi:hypothetical protein